MTWCIERIVSYHEPKFWGQGCAHYGFHDSKGYCYFLHFSEHWMGRLGPDDRFLWTAGAKADVQTDHHIDLDLKSPIFLAESPEGLLLVASAWSAKIHRIDPRNLRAQLLIDGPALGMKDASSCVYDQKGNIWVAELTGCRVWTFDSTGRVIETLGSGEPGFEPGAVSFEDAHFNWIYVMRAGPDGNLYVLDSMSFAVRLIDLDKRIVETIVGTGKPGHTGDGGDARSATLGGDPSQRFDGPYAMCVDEMGNIYIGDTQNHVVRYVDKSTGVISTIAGRSSIEAHKRNEPDETDPSKLNLPNICGMDYDQGRLFVPELDGDLVILRKVWRVPPGHVGL